MVKNINYISLKAAWHYYPSANRAFSKTAANSLLTEHQAFMMSTHLSGHKDGFLSR